MCLCVGTCRVSLGAFGLCPWTIFAQMLGLVMISGRFGRPPCHVFFSEFTPTPATLIGCSFFLGCICCRAAPFLLHHEVTIPLVITCVCSCLPLGLLSQLFFPCFLCGVVYCRAAFATPLFLLIREAACFVFERTISLAVSNVWHM